MIPALVTALTLAGFQRYSSMRQADVRIVETDQPGFTVNQCRVAQRRLWANLRKRYNVDQLGQQMGPPSPAGTSPPAVLFTGTPTSGDLLIVVSITTPGALGAAIFSWSKDGGATTVQGVLTAASVPLPGTGVSVYFPNATYSADNVYTASTPVPEEMLQWIADMATPRVYERRGANPTNDEALKGILLRAEEAYTAAEKAANSKDGLFDMALNADVGGSGISQGGPLGYTETSPYVWQDRQRAVGRFQDHCSDGEDDW